MRLKIDVSPGEVIDKLVILSIKAAHIDAADKLAHVRREMAALEDVVGPVIRSHDALPPLIVELREINQALWDIEDALRVHEHEADFGPDFVARARLVYQTNDRRAAVKAKINDLLGSDIAEQKAYSV